MKEQTIRKRLLTVQEAAIYLNVSPRTIYNSTGRRAKVPFPVPVKRIGKLLRFDLHDLDRYIESI